MTDPESDLDAAVSFSGPLVSLREYLVKRYGDRPPQLVWVAGLPREEGYGVRYEYADSSYIDAHDGRWTWYAPSTWTDAHSGPWDPMQSAERLRSEPKEPRDG